MYLFRLTESERNATLSSESIIAISIVSVFFLVLLIIIGIILLVIVIYKKGCKTNKPHDGMNDSYQCHEACMQTFL